MDFTEAFNILMSPKRQAEHPEINKAHLKNLVQTACRRADNHKWHDVLDHPKDLPKTSKQVEVIVRRKYSEYEMLEHACFTDGKWYVSHYGENGIDESSSIIVIKWRYD